MTFDVIMDSKVALNNIERFYKARFLEVRPISF